MYIISGTTQSSRPTLTRRKPRSGEVWRGLSLTERLSSRYREKFNAAGYEFGASILDVIHCPGCPKGAKPDPDKVALKAGLVEILGDDEDGIAATMEDFGL